VKYSSRLVILAVAVTAIIGVGCAKKKVAAQGPPPPSQPTTAAATPQPAPPQSRATTPTPAPATVAQQPSRMPNAQTRARIDTLLARIEDAYFDYDQHTLRPDAIKALQADSTELRDILKDYPDYKLSIEGHCDERGSAEYNMALGQERADAAKAYLVQVGIPSGQLATVSYGKEKPVCD
jgi:peptidoglycan-associated lipoprotein